MADSDDQFDFSSEQTSSYYAHRNHHVTETVGDMYGGEATAGREYSGHNNRQFYQGRSQMPMNMNQRLSSGGESAAEAAAVVAQEMNNVQTLKRLSIGAMSALDPDLPQFAYNNRGDDSPGQKGPPTPTSPSSSTEIPESQASQLLWVPAHVHPELAPQEWKTFVHRKVAEIRETVSNHPAPSSLSNETTSDFAARDSSLKRRNSRLSKQINNQDGYVDGSDVLKRKSSDTFQSISSLSAQLKTLGELESLAMDPFQLARSLSQTHALSYNAFQVNTDAAPTERERSASISLPVCEPLENDSDEPILPTLSSSLRRATRTRYGRSSLKKSRGGLSSKIDTSGTKSEKHASPERPEIPGIPEKHQRPSLALEKDFPPQRLVESIPKVAPLDIHSSAAAEPPPLSPIRPLVVNKIKTSLSPVESTPASSLPPASTSASNEVNDQSIPEDESLADSMRKTSLSGKRSPESKIPEQLQQQLQQLPRSYSHKSKPSSQSVSSIDATPKSDEEILPANLSVRTKIGTPSSLGTTTDVLSSIPIAEVTAAPLTSTKSEEESMAANKLKSRKSSWKRLFNSGSTDSNEKKPLIASTGTVDKESVDRLLNRSATDISDFSSQPSDKKGLSAFFSKKKSKREVSGEPSSNHAIAGGARSRSAMRSRTRSPEKRGRLQNITKGSASPAKSSSRYKAKDQKREQLEQQQQQQQQQPIDQNQAGYADQTGQEFSGGGVPYNIPPHQMSDKALVIMMYNRYPLHIERAIYRLSHLKLANPRRPLAQQVLLSNFMYAYLNLINHGYQQQQKRQMMRQQMIAQLQGLPAGQYRYGQYQEMNGVYDQGVSGQEVYDYGYQQEPYAGDDEVCQRYEHDQDIIAQENPKKSPSAESTSSSSSSSSVPGDDIWTGDEVVDVGDYENGDEESVTDEAFMIQCTVRPLMCQFMDARRKIRRFRVLV